MASCTDCGIGRVASGPNAGAFYLIGSVSALWARDCSLDTYNGLKCDPITGDAWVEPPIGAVGLDAIFQDNFIPGSNVTPLASTAIRTARLYNPSQCLPMTTYMLMQFGYGMTFDTPFEVDMVHLMAYAVNAPAPAPAIFDTWTIQGTMNGASRTVWNHQVLPDWFSPITVPPGGYVDMASQMVVGRVSALGFPVWATGGSQIVIKANGTNTQL